jgi:hypothetical protein
MASYCALPYLTFLYGYQQSLGFAYVDVFDADRVGGAEKELMT